MLKYRINGGNPLVGEVEISGSKNGCLPIIAATVLCDSPCTIENVPNISDVRIMLEILEHLGAKIFRNLETSTVVIDATTINNYVIPDDLGHKIRASYYFWPVLLVKFGKVISPTPGGCPLGKDKASRPLDQHILVFAKLGINCDVEIYKSEQYPQGHFEFSCDKINTNVTIDFNKITVGGTINAILATAKARGNGSDKDRTEITNAAREPHIISLCTFLAQCGASITGAMTDSISIWRRENFTGTRIEIEADQIEAGTFLILAAATRGNILVKNIEYSHQKELLDYLENAGARSGICADTGFVKIWVEPTDKLTSISFETSEYPGFPTDLQAQLSTLLTTVDGTSYVTENIWDNRFGYMNELKKMGAKILIPTQDSEKKRIIEGVPELHGGEEVVAGDLRGGMALIIAALMVNEGEPSTIVSGIHCVERGYENIVEKLRMLGADIEMFDDSALSTTTILAENMCNVKVSN